MGTVFAAKDLGSCCHKERPYGFAETGKMLPVYFFQMLHLSSHIDEQQIGQSQGAHGFHNDNGTGNDHGIVASGNL